MPLAPASTLIRRFAPALAATLHAHAVDAGFIEAELAAMADHRLTKTGNRSVVGIMTDFGYLADARRAERDVDDLGACPHGSPRPRAARSPCAMASPIANSTPSSPTGPTGTATDALRLQSTLKASRNSSHAGGGRV